LREGGQTSEIKREIDVLKELERKEKTVQIAKKTDEYREKRRS
jgi:hypothetical protein